jgi:uncharacterized membrane protein
MMTRKDYVNVSDILRAYQDEIPQTLFEDLIMDFADFFQADNDNFSPEKFENACYNSTNKLMQKVGE